MAFNGNQDYQHSSKQSVGILITNLGTPDGANKKDLKKYLKQFLSDPRLVESNFPRWVWLMILNLVILNIRPARSAKAYAKVWGQFGESSPLLDISLKQLACLKESLVTQSNGAFEIALGMRYGNPSIPSALKQLKSKNINKLLVLPLYPQYSATTTASTFDEVTKELQTWRLIPEVRFVNHYHDNPHYINALATSIKAHRKSHGKPDKLVISYHGIPKRYVNNGDPYFCECHKTTRLLAEKLTLNDDEFVLTFQSIFGREEWLKPYTSETLKSLPAQGSKHIQIICPGFSADCLETLEEIEEENREYFMASGGEKFSYIPALNTNPDHIDMLQTIIAHHTVGWLDEKKPDSEENKSQQLYKNLIDKW